MLPENQLVSDIGEKRLISEFIRPLFDGVDHEKHIGDDCAVISIPKGKQLLLSTDRVPADLIAFKIGLIDHRELGRYLGYLNLSDIAACGGKPVGLLLNAGIPQNLRLGDFLSVCKGVQEAVKFVSGRVYGGDISSA